MVIGGIIMGWFLAPLILAFSIPASMARSYYSSNSSAVVWVLLGIGLAVVGLIFLLVGISRALRTLDHLGRKSAERTFA
jgi:dipeptide/tripeptide permease